MDQYTYAALQGDQVRLLRIPPSSPQPSQPFSFAAEGENVYGSLETHPLGRCPNYTALSYCWGHGPPAHPLIVDGRRLLIGDNLYSFLLQSTRYLGRNSRAAAVDTNNSTSHSRRTYDLRSRRQAISAPRIVGDEKTHGSSQDIQYLWSDAICIDQRETAEKNAQLALMRDIYASASRIVIWLGQGDESSNTAMDVWQRVARHMRDGRDLGLRLGLTDGEFAALHSLQRREYWNRVWVVQEASTVSVPREIWCGEKRVAFDDALLVNEAARQYIMTLGHIPTPNPWISELGTMHSFEQLRKLRRSSKHGKKASDAHSLLSILYMTKDLKASNLRDKIYALLPIYSDIHGGPLPPVNYGRPVEVAFQETAAFILGTEMDVRIFLLCSLSGPLGSSFSWVPHFKHFAESLTLFGHEDKFRVSRDLPPTVSVDSNMRFVTFRGACIGTVGAVHQPLAGPGDQATSASTAVWQPKLNTWIKSLAAFLFPQKVDRPYAGGGSVSQAADRLVALDFCPGIVLERTGKVSHWPFLEVAAGAKPPRLEHVSSSFADLLLRVGHASVFWDKSGHLGLGDPALRAGDMVVACFGLAVPLIIRPGGLFDRIVGPCFVQGMMDGEGLQRMVAEDFKVF